MHKVVARIDPYYQDRFRPWMAAARRLRDAGFDLRLTDLSDDAVGDVNVVQLDALVGDRGLWERLIDRNLVVYERTGCAPVSSKPSVRRMLNDPRLRGWIKDILCRDPAMYNAPMVQSRLHLTWLPMPDGTVPQARPQAVPLTPDALAKVGSHLPIHMYPRMDPFLDRPGPPTSRRGIDLFFAGNMDFPLPQVAEHRRRACEAILATGRRAVIYAGNLLKTDAYRQMLQQPKIMVSPYGSGGYSWKDFECMYMGVVVIKPENGFSKTYGFDLFDGDRHVLTCRPDFSDLPEVVERVLDDQPFFDELTARNREAILRARDDDMVARDLLGLLTRALEGGLPAGADAARA